MLLGLKEGGVEGVRARTRRGVWDHGWRRVGKAVGALEGVPGTTVGEGVETLVGEVEEALEGMPATMVGEGVGTLCWERQWDCWQCPGPQWEKEWVKHSEKE